MFKISITIMLLLLYSITVTAQEQNQTNTQNESESFEKRWHISGVISHTYIGSNGKGNQLFVPSWGLNIGYRLNHKLGIGLHSDIRADNFVVLRRNNNEEIERKYPLVFTLDALYNISNSLVLTVGPGIEVEQNESFGLARIGLEYEYEIGTDFYLMPTLFYDQRFDGYSTTTIGLGLGFKL